MKAVAPISHKVQALEDLKKQVAAWKAKGKSVAFTNGCFDILHEGHIFSLTEAAKEADYLIVAVNSDSSVKQLKGPERPINTQQSRSLLLSHLAIVDAVVIFDEQTPLELIKALLPDVIVKGGDYTVDQIVGSKEVISAGGRVIINPIVAGFSTTGIIQQIKSSYS
jgi:D-glycero-beta-D-manno-heptose 1-phosphate adenylyltransferase